MASAGEASGLHDYARVVRRRKWAIVPLLVLLPLAALTYSLRQEPLYEASARVLLVPKPTELSAVSDLVESGDPARDATTLSNLARVTTVVERTVGSARADELLAASSVHVVDDSDLLEFRVTDPDRGEAARLATSYAGQFTRYVGELETTAIRGALRSVRSRLGALARAGRQESLAYQQLLSDAQQLRTAEALKSSPALVVQPARQAVRIRPRPARTALLGLGIALLLGTGLAFLLEALDTRPRSSYEVAEQLDMPLVGRIPRAPRHGRSLPGVAMLAAPHGREAQAYRILRANLDLSGRHGVLMVTSALGGEGKSTVAANLAVAAARAGERVLLADLDLRRPSIARMFGLQDSPGASDVALRGVPLAQALHTIALSPQQGLESEGPGESGGSATSGNGRQNGAGPTTLEGVLEVLPAGSVEVEGDQLFGSDAFEQLMAGLRQHAGRVIIDAPPLLGTGDAVVLSARVDSLMVVSRLGLHREGTLRELQRILQASPTAKVGVVLTGVDGGDGNDYYEAAIDAQVQPVEREHVE